MSTSNPNSAVLSRSDKVIRIYCPAHNLGFTAPRSEQIYCESSGHELDHAFPQSSFWEYCCDCQHYWPVQTGKANFAEAECPVCERRIAKRFICHKCKIISAESENPGRRKVFSLSADGTPTPSCPGCLGESHAKVLEHECSEFGATFSTPLSTCPFCEKVLEPPPSFPCSVSEYLKRIQQQGIPLAFNAEQNTLETSPTGNFLLLERIAGSSAPIVIPRAATLKTKQDYYSTYFELFNCDNPTSGEVVVRAPALVEQVNGSWVLREAGIIDIAADATAGKTNPVEKTVCSFCAKELKPEHSFCKYCGTARGSSNQVVPESTQTSASRLVPISQPSEVVVSSVTTSLSAFPAKAVIGGLVGLLVLVVIVAMISYSNVKSSLETKLDDAINKGRLLEGTDNARSLYEQLKGSGANEQKLSAYRAKLTPLLTNHGFQLTTNLIEIGYNEPNANEWLEAGNKLDWAVELNPNDQKIASRAAYCDGRAAYLQKQLNVALETWTRAASLDKTWVLPVNGLGMIYTARRDYPTARSYFTQASQLDPKWAFPYENIGNTYWQEKDFANARSF